MSDLMEEAYSIKSLKGKSEYDEMYDEMYQKYISFEESRGSGGGEWERGKKQPPARKKSEKLLLKPPERENFYQREARQREQKAEEDPYAQIDIPSELIGQPRRIAKPPPPPRT